MSDMLTKTPECLGEIERRTGATKEQILRVIGEGFRAGKIDFLAVDWSDASKIFYSLK